jgi:hypothetical protein
LARSHNNRSSSLDQSNSKASARSKLSRKNKRRSRVNEKAVNCTSAFKRTREDDLRWLLIVLLFPVVARSSSFVTWPPKPKSLARGTNLATSRMTVETDLVCAVRARECAQSHHDKPRKEREDSPFHFSGNLAPSSIPQLFFSLLVLVGASLLLFGFDHDRLHCPPRCALHLHWRCAE